MPQVINTNIASLNAQRNLNASQNAANTALERLSSGLRINSAKDDAAGLAISERFQSQITGLSQAQRNANDGISLAQTAEGAMDEITNNLQRIRELAVQSANATNSISDRQALNQEVQQRIEEINRISAQTSFNGLKVLDGTFSTQTFQVGANTGETISLSGLDSRGSQIGSIISQSNNLGSLVVDDIVAGTTSSSSAPFVFGTGSENISGTVSVNGVELTIAADEFADIDGLAEEVQTQIQAKIDSGTAEEAAAVADINVSAADGALVFTSDKGEAIPASVDLAQVANAFAPGDVAAVSDDNNFTVGDFTNFNFASGNLTAAFTLNSETVTFDATGVTDRDSLISAINEQIVAETTLVGDGVVASFSGNDLVFTNTTGADLAVAAVAFSDGGSTLDEAVEVAGQTGTSLIDAFERGDDIDFQVDLDGQIVNIEGARSLNDIIGQVNAKSNETGISANLNARNNDIVFSSQFGEEFTISVNADIDGDGSFGGTGDLSQTITGTVADNTVAVNEVDISTSEGADLAMIAIDYAIDTINGFRAELGAVQNRFESTIANLATTSENLSAANSRIRDADFAAESAELARTQVLQQAGLSVLAQANARPQQVLQLLQG